MREQRKMRIEERGKLEEEIRWKKESNAVRNREDKRKDKQMALQMKTERRAE